MFRMLKQFPPLAQKVFDGEPNNRCSVASEGSTLSCGLAKNDHKVKTGWFADLGEQTSFCLRPLSARVRVMRLGTEPVTKFYRKGVDDRLIKGVFEQRAEVVVILVGQVAAAGINDKQIGQRSDFPPISKLPGHL